MLTAYDRPLPLTTDPPPYCVLWGAVCRSSNSPLAKSGKGRTVGVGFSGNHRDLVIGSPKNVDRPRARRYSAESVLPALGGLVRELVECGMPSFSTGEVKANDESYRADDVCGTGTIL
jgi:hypothetical protein